MTAHAIKHNHKPTATPPLTFTAAADKQFLPPLDDNDYIDADPADLMGNYDGRGKNMGKGGHPCRYRDDNDIEALRGLYEEPNDEDNSGRDNDDNDGDWDDMEKKEREDDNDDDDDVVDITAVKFFGMPNEAFLGKETENNKKKEEEEEKSKGDNDDGVNNSGGGVKTGKKMRVDINIYASKGDNKDAAE